MIDNFTLAVIIRETEKVNNNTELKIFVSPPLSETYKEISDIWDEQHDTFLKKRTRTYIPNRKITSSEYFVLKPYILPKWLTDLKIDTERARRLEKRVNIDNESIVALVGLATDKSQDKPQEVIMFQNFTKRYIIKPNSLISIYRGYEHIDKPHLIVMPNSITALYYPSKSKLYFKAYDSTRRFLTNLEEIYHENSKEIIKEVLENNIVECKEPVKSQLIMNCSNKLRKSFHELKEGGILDRISVEKLQEEFQSKGYEIEVYNGKIVISGNDEEELIELFERIDGNRTKRVVFNDVAEEEYIIKEKTKRANAN